MVHLRQGGEPFDLPAADTSSRLQVKATGSDLMLQACKLQKQLCNTISKLLSILRALRQRGHLHLTHPHQKSWCRAGVVWVI
jgi:hypothetical protein